MGAVLGFVGGFSSGLVKGNSLGNALQLGALGAGIGAAAVLAPAHAMLISILSGGAVAGASDYITQTLSGKPYSLSSTVYAVTAGGLVGAAVGWVPGAPGVL